MNALDFLYFGLAGVTAPWWARKSRGGWRERRGFVASSTRARNDPPGPAKPRLLLHAVSVGEVSALRELVPLLLPEARVIVSATTDTGIARARELFGATCEVVRFPLDFSWMVRRFLDAVKPDAVALVELELWPNFVRACRARRVPVCIINGRLSARSFKGYRRLRRFISPVFASLEFAAVQDEAYAQRFEAMGVAPNSCLTTGSMKWDSAKIVEGRADALPGAAALAASLGIDRSRPLIVAGSTGPLPGGGSEEAMLHAACPPGAQLLCAPRKPERFEEAAAAMPGCVRRSANRGAAPSAPPESARTPRPTRTDRFLLDTIGELRLAYALADIAVVGRSFGGLYGSDPIEPIGLGRPTVIGPCVSDFESIVSAFEADGAIVRADKGSISRVLADLLADARRRADLAERGRACIRAHQGAAARHAELLLSLLEAPSIAPHPPGGREREALPSAAGSPGEPVAERA